MSHVPRTHDPTISRPFSSPSSSIQPLLMCLVFFSARSSQHYINSWILLPLATLPRNPGSSGAEVTTRPFAPRSPQLTLPQTPAFAHHQLHLSPKSTRRTALCMGSGCRSSLRSSGCDVKMRDYFLAWNMRDSRSLERSVDLLPCGDGRCWGGEWHPSSRNLQATIAGKRQ